MVYISGGQVLGAQSPWRLSIISETFWSIINFIVLFFRTMISPATTARGDTYRTDYRVGRDDPFNPGGGGGPRPQRRMGGFRGAGGGTPSPPPMAGGG